MCKLNSPLKERGMLQILAVLTIPIFYVFLVSECFVICLLQNKNLDPVLMAYDRPSPKFLAFLAKHYCLTQSVPQVQTILQVTHQQIM